MVQVLNRKIALTCGVLAFAITSSVHAQNLNIALKNEGNSDFFLTPVWFGLHNGSFDLFNAGSAASASLELIAEEGDVSGLMADFTAAPIPDMQGLLANAAGFPGAPVIDPGETASVVVTPITPANYRYFSYASMVIPSNDSFIGNGNPTAYEVFDAAGNFSGPLTIQIFGNQIWDAGTEVNNTTGAAFSTVGGMGTVEGGTVALLPAGGLDNFAGTGIPPGGTIGNLIGANELLATISITQVPEPSSLALIGLAIGGLTVFRRRRS